MRRFLKISAVLSLILFILLITASIVVRLYFPPEKIKALVVSKVAESLGRKVSVGDVYLSPFRGIDIRDIYIGEDASLGDIPFIKVRSVTVGYSFSEMLRKRIVLSRVTIEGPEVYVRSKEGRFTFSELIKRPPPEVKPRRPLPVTILLKRGDIRDLNLFYDAEGSKASIKGLSIALDGELYPFKGMNVSLSSGGSGSMAASAKGIDLISGLIADLRLRLKGTKAFSAQGELSLKEVKAGIEGKSLLPFDAFLGMDLTGDISGGAEIKGISLAVGHGNRFDIAGKIRSLKGLKGLDVWLTGESDLGEVSRIAKEFLPFPVGGAFKIDKSELSGDLPDSLNLKAEASLKGVTASYKGFALPLDGIAKVEADSRGDVVISELNISSGGIGMVRASARASKWGKGKVGGDARVVADNMKLIALLPKGVFERMGKVNVSGETRVDIKAARDSEKGPIKMKVTGNSIMKGLHAGPLSMEEPRLTFSVASEDLAKGKTAADAGLKAKSLSLGKGDFNIRNEDVGVNISASSPDMFRKNASVMAEVKARAFRLNKGDVSLREGMAKAAFSASGDFRAGNISVKAFDITMPELLRARIDGEIKGWGRDLLLKADVEEIDHGKVMDRLPESLKQRLPNMEVEGRSAIKATVSGSASGENPLDVTGTLRTKGLALSFPGEGIKLRNSEGDIEFDLSPSVRWISGNVKIGSLEKEGLLEGPLSASAGFELLMDGPNLRVKELSVRIPRKGASFSVSGDVQDYMKGPRPNLDLIFSFSSPKYVDIFKGLNASGAAVLKGSVISGRERELAMSCGLRMEHLNLSYKERAKVRNLKGEIKMSQGIRYAKGLELIPEQDGKETPSPFTPSLYGLMRPYVKKGYDLTLESLSFDGYEAGPLSMDIAWDNGKLVIDRYDLALFDGLATGRIQASYKNGVPEYSVSSNIAGVRFDRIFKDIKGGEGLGINADLNLKGKGTDIEGDVNVTKIGKKILDRGLLRLDPNESNPQIVDIRRRVNSLGWVPKEVFLWIRHGELNMDITLQRRRFTLLSIVSLEKIPVRRIPVGYLIKKALKKDD